MSIEAKRTARKAVGAHANCPVVVVAGITAPRIAGESWHYRTRGGTLVHYPSAYARRGWSNLVYHASTLRVEIPAEVA